MLHASSNPNLRYLASGAKISNNAGLFRNGGIVQAKSGNDGAVGGPFGSFPQSHTGFAGFKFTQGGQSHFGWIRLEWKGTLVGRVTGIPTSLTAIDWAYDTVAGQSINAGQTTAVPEPSTCVLALLASGSAGVLAWRKRQSAAASTTDATGGGESSK